MREAVEANANRMLARVLCILIFCSVAASLIGLGLAEIDNFAAELDGATINNPTVAGVLQAVAVALVVLTLTAFMRLLLRAREV